MAKAERELIDTGLEKEIHVNLDRDGMLELAMQSLPTLRRERLELFDLETAAQETRDMIAGRESDIYSDVCAKVGADGKAIFSNDGARKAEAAKVAAKDAVLTTARKKARDEARAIAIQRGEIESTELGIKIARDYMHGYN